ncbi:tetratricopeptide repeat protein [Herbiconiux sp. L3-i23]|uniref:tetratricopeptide repeat protein n=1 Tax=Herbiconiux sp. L3-i23 TaxID=2905871 RepID=UPI002054D3DB|nr:tetratricopeptide repeat protein [Herbiconiux sp. L3-i23]BDI21932.1 co-chaperone YbbN [Herbiconiux sp. L3-i23]
MSTPVPPLGNLRGGVDLSPLLNRAQQPANAPQGGAPAGDAMPVPSLVLEGTDANFGQVLELSRTVPIVVDLWAEWCEPCKTLSPALERIVKEYAGRLLLVTIDVDANPQLGQAFHAESLPTVAAVLAGRPVSLFVGALPEEQVREVFDQLLGLAAQNGVTGTVAAQDQGAAPSAADETPVEEPLPPHHAEAYEAIERGDYDAAIAEYKTAIAQNPNDSLAVAGLAQVSLIARLRGKTLDGVRSAAAAAPADLEAQLDVADVDLSGGHVEDSFDRLLTLFPSLDQQGKDRVRARLLEYFEIVGADEPRVADARRRLANLLY